MEGRAMSLPRYPVHVHEVEDQVPDPDGGDRTQSILATFILVALAFYFHFCLLLQAIAALCLPLPM
jgi:hypothetical protein